MRRKFQVRFCRRAAVVRWSPSLTHPLKDRARMNLRKRSIGIFIVDRASLDRRSRYKSDFELLEIPGA